MAKHTSNAQCTVDRFCYQYLQMEPSLDYPDGSLLKVAQIQEEIFDRLFVDQSAPSPKIARFQLCTLKELVRRIQESISDEETDEVADRLMNRIGELMSMPRTSELDEAQQRCIVSYRLSLLQTPVMIDILENRSLIAASGTTGLRTWEAALHLGQYLCVNSHLIQGNRVLELGAGTGYLSIVCAKHLGAAHVTASDGSEKVIDNLTDNLTLNDIHWSYNVSAESAVTPRLLEWGHALVGTEEAVWNGGREIDVIIGSDITYDQRAHTPLIATLRDLLDLFPSAVIIIAIKQRNVATLTAFQESCSRNQLNVETLNFTLKEVHDVSQRQEVLTPFYSSSAPICIFHISRTE
ncbi:hypothetical protein M406DRAFT_267193 [Cryphonectria parasitica EP155]|uniref:FAM86 N-terminal domain-containing protein n=1 Tax=Cryphonectria parasitica (strain ATCC 38755 / EP155) TaxID=660469 RepID=A0A9P4XTP3_CRYP1|nr:uncharacterized protein M406DRAFT_267193 [Cryphonectria parasitica EP155]KAF3760470.1 hypothetical protein M406DRAFT_267193 [Cryphonectria parasitica EP155]